MEIIFAALEFEISGLLKLSKAKKIFQKQHCAVYRGTYAKSFFLFVITGMGKDNVFFAFQYAYDHYFKDKNDNALIYLFGFCGVSNRARIADIVIYESVSYQDRGNLYEMAVFCPADMIAKLVKLQERKAIGLHCFRASTVLDIVSASSEKDELEKSFCATAFDMESFFLIKAAKAESIEVAVIRSISDNIENPIPKALGKISGKKPLRSLSMFAHYIFSSKKNAIVFFHTFHNFMKARRSLLDAFVEIFKD
jgi:nucleoside phosphorylase